VGVRECPLENNPQDNEGETRVKLVLSVRKGRRWYCINPKHPRLMDDSGLFSKCFDSECYYLRKVLGVA